MLSGDEGALPLALMLDVILLREIDFHGLRRLVPGVSFMLYRWRDSRTESFSKDCG